MGDEVEHVYGGVCISPDGGRMPLGPRREAKGVRGLRDLLTSNRVTSPPKSSAYTPFDLVRDAFEGPRAAGGWPDVLLVSTSFLAAFAYWHLPLNKRREDPVLFGIPVRAYEVASLNGVRIVEAPTLGRSTAVSLTSGDVRMRREGPAISPPMSHLDDRDIGLTIEVGDEAKHAWIEGIVAFGRWT